MYRLVIESLLGLRLEVNRLRIEPLFPRGWEAFDVHYRHGNTVYHVHVRNLGAGGGNDGGARGVTRVTCDGVDEPDRTIPLRDDGQEHRAEVEIGVLEAAPTIA
jgi:cellobiose phosphorylase